MKSEYLTFDHRFLSTNFDRPLRYSKELQLFTLGTRVLGDVLGEIALKHSICRQTTKLGNVRSKLINN